MNRRGLSQWFCLLLLLFLSVVLVSGPAFAGTGFSDVSDSHWAAKHISKMGSTGIVGGYSDGTFRPNQPVKQVEAVVMAVRCMDDNAGSSSISVPFTVPSWAESDVARALSVGLIKSDEAFYAKSGATRAWITRLLVRIVGKDGEARSEQVMPNFIDSYKIPDWATGYVRVAQEYNLVGGYSDNSFQPTNAVTRAELAVLLGRALEFTGESSSDTIKGRVLETSFNNLTINTDAGERRNFTLPSGVSVYDENGQIAISDLQRYDRVSLVVDGETVKYIEKVPGDAISDVVNGIIEEVYPEAGAVVVEVPAGNLRTLYLPEGADLSVSGSNRQGLTALQYGDEVEVSLTSDGYISGIMVKNRSQETYNEGIVYDLNVDVSLITLQGEDGKLYSHRLAENAVVTMDSYRFPTLEDVHKGDRVSLEVEDGAVREINVLEVSSRLSMTGTVIIISPEDRVITLEVEEQLKSFRVTADADINISGLENARLDDVVIGDEVQVQVENGEVTSLEIEGRQVENEVTGTVVGVDTGNRVLTLKDKQDKLQAYEVRDNARVLIEGDEGDLGDIEKDMDVEARLLDEEIMYLEVDNSLEGTVDSLDDEGLLLVLRDQTGDRETYVIDDNVDIDSEDDRNDLDEINRGDYVEITLDDDVVTEIQLRTQLILRVDRVREQWDRIETEDEDGDDVRLYVRDGVDLAVPGIDYPDLDDVKEDDTVRATFLGNDLDKVEVLEPKRGKVTSVNTYAETITFDYYNGKTATLDFDSDCEIIIDDDDYDRLNMISRGDRVEVLENVEGGYDFKVMEQVTGTLAFDVDDVDEVYLEDDYRGWEDYDVYNNVYVQDSGGSLSLRSLNKGDNVTLYLLNDLVYEIELR
ncbi:MAG: hypothetical protein FH756_18090 [Firmicutes bacterium]|nr:hypothetical protein [Bacillota bacterium]